MYGSALEIPRPVNFSAASYNIQMTHKFFALITSLTLLLQIVTTISPASNCLGNCIACSDNNPLLCRPLLNSTSGKEYPCLPYYTGSNCQQTAAAYFNIYNETSIFTNWSLPSPPPTQTCKLLPSASSNKTDTTNTSFPAIGPFSSQLNASKSLSFSAAQNVQRLVIKISVAVADSVLYNGTVVANETTTETTDAQGNIIIETVSTNNKKSTLSSTIPFLKLEVTDQLNSNSLLASFSATYSTVSSTNTSCGFVYQYEFVVDAASSPLRQVRLNFYLSTPNSQTTWYLLGFSAEAGCSGFAVSSGSGKCSTCLSGFYPLSDPDGKLQLCKICDYRCITCSSSSVCLLCEAYTTSSVVGKCEYPEIYGVYRDFKVITGKKLNLSSQAGSQLKIVVGSEAQLLNLALQLPDNQSYLLKFHLLYTQNYAQNLSQLSLTVNGKPYTTLNSLDLLASTLLQQANSASAQLFATPIKIDLMGKPCLQNFTMGLKGTSQSNEQFYVADIVLVQYSCGQNCLDCVFSTSQSNTCTQCKPFFSLAQNCKTCANGFYLKNGSACVKCYSNCKQCNGPAVNQCTECLSSFTFGEMSLDRSCIPCLFDFWNGTTKNCNNLCPQNFSIGQLQFNSNCSACLKADKNKMYSSASCMSCWIFLGIGSGKCVPTAASGYVFYSNDLTNDRPGSTLWRGSENLTSLTCTSDYVNIYGIGQPDNHTVKTASSLNYTLTGLPAHRGITLVFNIFKIDDWILENNATNSTINITVNSPGYQGNTFNIKLTNQFGSNICGGNGREMIWAMQTNLNDHIGSQVTMTLNAPDQGIFVRQLQVYLGNCPDCREVGLAYEVFGIPMYSDNDTQTGLDLWITFNHPVYYNSQGNSTPSNSKDAFANSFKFSVEGGPVPNATLTANQISTFNYLKYFLPLSQSYKNATLTVNTQSGDLVYTSDGSVTRQLVSSSSVYVLQRYDNASSDTRRSTSQLSTFFLIFTWITLICMIVTVMLNVGVLFEQFSVMMQLIYYHIYITSPLLPPTLKVPLANAVRMEHLNYFSNIAAIENNLFGDLTYPSDYIFQQFNVDVYFLRSFYPILIINAILMGWFIIHALLYRLVPACQQSESKLFRFLRSISQRPLAYFDQLWRYQFLATMWACMLQFTDFKAKGGGQALNLLICVLAFSASIIWPLIVTIYTYRKHQVMSVNHFRYSYHDIYYLKISSVADQPKYYLYVGVRFGKLLGYAIFIALFVNQSIIGPVLLIFLNILEGVVAYFLQIYRSSYYLFTRIVENLLLCVAALLCLIVYANRNSLNQDSFQNLGYGLATVFVLMIINGICRFAYLIYKKAYEWKIGTYDVGQQGEKEDYEGKGEKEDYEGKGEKEDYEGKGEKEDYEGKGEKEDYEGKGENEEYEGKGPIRLPHTERV